MDFSASYEGRIRGAWTYSPFGSGDSPRNDDHPNLGYLQGMVTVPLQGMATVPQLLIVPEMGIVLGRDSVLLDMVTFLPMVTILGMVSILWMVTVPATVRSKGF